MEKPLTETTIEIPPKTTFHQNTDNDESSQSVNPNPISAHAESLSHLLPPNTYAQITPRYYVFPGAEVTPDNMESDDDDSSDDSTDDDETEDDTRNEEANEIIVPDIDDPAPKSPMLTTPTTSVSSLSPTPSQLQFVLPDHEVIVENLNNIEAVDANEEFEPVPLKRPRLETDRQENLNIF